MFIPRKGIMLLFPSQIYLIQALDTNLFFKKLKDLSMTSFPKLLCLLVENHFLESIAKRRVGQEQDAVAKER